MRIALLILSATFILQSSPPPTSNGSKEQRPFNQKQKAAAQSPTQSVIAITNNQDCPCQQENRAKTETQQRPEKPPWWDVAWSTLGLVVVGFFGTLAAIWTLFLVRRQGKDTKTTAEAALLNAKAIINAERAWIDAELIPKVSIVTRYDLRVTNHGKTPARLSSYEINYGRTKEDGTWSFEELKGKFSKRLEIFVGSNGSKIFPDFNFTKMFASLTDSSTITTGFIFFTISYADVVATEPWQIGGHDTRIGYKYDILTDSIEPVPISMRYT